MNTRALVISSISVASALAASTSVRMVYLEEEKKKYTQMMGGYLFWKFNPHHAGLVPRYEIFKSIVDFNVIDFATIELDAWSFVNMGGYQEKFRRIGNDEFLREVDKKLDLLLTIEQKKVDKALLENKPPPKLPKTLMQFENRQTAFDQRFELIAELQKRIQLGKRDVHTNRSINYKFVIDPAYLLEQDFSKPNGSCVIS